MTTDWTRRTQHETKTTATRNREGWTSADLELVAAFADDVTDAELARTLHRTLYSVQTIKHAIQAGRAVGSTRAAQTATSARREWVEGMGDGEGLL